MKKLPSLFQFLARSALVFGLASFSYSATARYKAKMYDADIVIYGGTSAAVIATVEAVHSGKSVLVVSPDSHLGGLSSGGLGFTDTGNKSVIGGLSREFYHRARAGASKYYGRSKTEFVYIFFKTELIR